MNDAKFEQDDVEIIDSRTMIIKLRPRVRVVSFKLDENTLAALDLFTRRQGLGSRSMVLKNMVMALVKIGENIGGGKLVEICTSAKYLDGANEKTTSICFKT